MDYGEHNPNQPDYERYQVRVRTHLSPEWSHLFRASSVETGYDEKGHPITTVMLRVADRAELMGILNEIHGINLPILAVQYIDDLPSADK